jgi:Icc-related predicted phosphoesterase
MIIDCISDIHGHYPKLEGGDLLIIAGDYTRSDRVPQWKQFFEWLKPQKYRKKILIAGNHDNMLTQTCTSEKSRELGIEVDTDFEYLCDNGIEFEGLKIWGTPSTKTFKGMNRDCKAFTLNTEEELGEKFALIPEDIDILVSHGPVFGHHDFIESVLRDGSFFHVGSTSLNLALQTKKNLKLIVCGHIHEGYGIEDFRHLEKVSNCLFPVYVNASYVNEYYYPVNKPIRVIL